MDKEHELKIEISKLIRELINKINSQQELDRKEVLSDLVVLLNKLS